MLQFLAPFILEHFCPASTLLHGHLALATLSPPESDPEEKLDKPLEMSREVVEETLLILQENQRDFLLELDVPVFFFHGQMNYEGSTHPMSRLRKDAKGSCQQQEASCKRAENGPITSL